KSIRNAVHPLHRRYRTKQEQLRYNQLSTAFYSDTMFSAFKSVLNNSCGQIFVNDLEFVRFIPMRSKSEAGDTLAEFIQDVGVPVQLHTDNAKEENAQQPKVIRLRFYGRMDLLHLSLCSFSKNLTPLKLPNMQ
ncbi:MAG: hypothetical protein ACREOZ_01975, partial [Gloeomargaritales cyanobacterium]